jgi:pilus assembly protein CpaE
MSSKILVVDDSQMMNQMIRDILSAAGYETKSALYGSQALEILMNWNPDLVLLDVMMPDMDGFEVCRRIRQINPARNVPVIMVTAKASIEDKQKGFEAGADDYITKPFEPIELKLRLSAILKRTGQQYSQKPAKQRQVVVVHSLRGGSGCTSLAVNIAVGLQHLWEEPVALVDLVRPLGVCCSMLNLQPYRRLDYIVDQSPESIARNIDELLSTHESGIKLLGGFSDPVKAEKLTENLVSLLLNHLMDLFTYVVVDTSHDFLPPTIAAFDNAETIVIPVTPDINAARLTQKELATLGSLGSQEKALLVYNRIFEKQGVQVGQLEKFLGKKFAMEIPCSEGDWNKAINSGKPMIMSDSESSLMHSLEDLVWKLSGQTMRASKPERPTAMWSRIQKRNFA